MDEKVQILENLCGLCGVSGDETDVREYIINYVRAIPDCQVKTDLLGNVIVEKKGGAQAAKKLMLAAHMDEVGFIITNITDQGFLKFACVGGIDASAVFERSVLVGRKKIKGVIAANPVHLLTAEQKDSVPKIDSMYIDIGVKDKQQAEELVQAGENAYFEPGFVFFGDGKICSKALDDRFGCMLLLDFLKKDLPYDCTVCFCVQEEVGLRGSKTAAYQVAPDYAIVVDATTAGDIAGSSEENCVCRLGRGPVIPFMDKATVYDRQLVRLAMQTAVKHGISAQYKTAIAGGNDAGSIHVSRGGVRTVALSLPTRYIHGENCVCALEDIRQCAQLLEHLSMAVLSGEC